MRSVGVPFDPAERLLEGINGLLSKDLEVQSGKEEERERQADEEDDSARRSAPHFQDGGRTHSQERATTVLRR